MKNKMKNKKGFTLMEMLIVVAIMVILVAVSIPVFTSNLSEAEEAVNAANMRSAKSLALTQYMLDSDSVAAGDYYDAELGSFTDGSNIEGYGKGSEDGEVLKIKTIGAGTVELEWVADPN